MDKGSYLVFAQEFAQGSKKLSVSRTEITERIPKFQVGPLEVSISSVVFLFSVFFSP